jgi:hypothetical protein
VYVLCRQLEPGARLFPALAAFLFAVYPLHILLSASDALPAFSLFLTAASYVLLAGGADDPPVVRRIRYLGGVAGLSLLTQVRYENALFFVPVALAWLARRRALPLRELLPAVLAGGAFIAFYAAAALTSELSFQNPILLSAGVERLIHHIALNPFLALPSLLLGTIGVWMYAGAVAGILAVLPWLVALGLAFLVDTGHGAARVYAGWLILILPVSAYGFSLMLAAPEIAAKLVAAMALLHLAVQPISSYERLADRHLEMRDNDFFREVLAHLPPGVEQIVVPDDEILRRHSHSTNEVFQKYAMILAGYRELAPRPRLVSLTQFVEQPEPGRCAGGECVFFFGLPCLEQRVYPYAREQCQAVLATHRATLLRETSMAAAPFLDCAIYTGAQYRRFCRPGVKSQSMAAYRIEG